ncbi:MAG: hypothetical protein U1F36_10760 [Planctomycetota bacterium]
MSRAQRVFHLIAWLVIVPVALLVLISATRLRGASAASEPTGATRSAR